MIPARGLVTLRKVETPETMLEGCILLTSETREQLTSHQMEVVQVGAPAYCLDEDCERCNRLLGMVTYPEAFTHPTTTKPGDWVLVRHRSLTETHEDGLYACSQDDVLAILKP